MEKKPFNGTVPENFGKTFTPEERKRNSSKGGKKSVETKRRRKETRQVLEALLGLKLGKGKSIDIDTITSFAELMGKNITVNEAIQIKQVQKALKGDLASATYIRDTVGDKPKEQLQLEGEINNPFKDLTTEELRNLANGSDETE